MNLLLDTHVLLWWLDDPAVLAQQARSTMTEPNNRVIVSIASVWEIAIKKALGKLEAPDDLEAMIEDAGFELMPIAFPHAWAIKDLPHYHDDPFDRLLVAQAKVEGLTLITRDERLKQYGIRIIEA
ncbi:MAG: type II toxin-antitoxin system VapC family toxin [Candidatus Poribacteria bacterium]|nr:type II toxin-antitoxin system VapC family toxin [Candidatus Poribacteria bacterium]